MSPQSANRCGHKYVSELRARLGKMVMILKEVERGEHVLQTTVSLVRKR